MKLFVVLVCLALALALIGPALVASQSCSTTFRGSPMTNFKCDSIVTTDTVLLLTAGQAYEDVDASAQESARLFGAFVPPACRTAALRLVCLGKFLKCTASPTTGLTLYPPCRSVCETMVLECSAVAAQLGVSTLLPNCDQTSNATGTTVPIYPPDFSGQCVTGPQQLAIPYSQADCPYPLQYDAKGTVGDPLDMCKKKCRSTVWSDSEWIGGYTLVYVLGLISFLLGFYLLSSWLLNPKTRRFPFNTITFFVFSLWPVSFVVMWGAFFNMAGEDIMCTWDNPPQPIEMDNAGDNHGQGVACVMQGIVTYYCVLACVIWWCFVNVDCALQLFLNIRIEKFRWLQAVYHAIGWGVPLVGLAFLLGFEKIGYENSFPVCQIYLDEKTSWWDWSFFFGPIMFFTLLGMILMFPGIIFFIVMSVSRRIKGLRAKYDVIAFSRLYVALFIIWCFIIFLLAYRADVEDQREEVIQAVTDQVKCSLLTGDECELETTFNQGLWYLSIIALVGLLPLTFITLGTTKVTWEFWIKLFRCTGEESPPKHVWSVISGRHLEDDDRGFELRQVDKD